MDLIVIIVNDYKTRKRIKTYLRDNGLEGFIMMDSSGTSYIEENYHRLKSSVDLPFDALPNNQSKGKTLFVLNNNGDKTEAFVDAIGESLMLGKRPYDLGIVFSISVGTFFTPHV